MSSARWGMWSRGQPGVSLAGLISYFSPSHSALVPQPAGSWGGGRSWGKTWPSMPTSDWLASSAHGQRHRYVNEQRWVIERRRESEGSAAYSQLTEKLSSTSSSSSMESPFETRKIIDVAMGIKATTTASIKTSKFPSIVYISKFRSSIWNRGLSCRRPNKCKIMCPGCCTMPTTQSRFSNLGVFILYFLQWIFRI